MKYPPVLCFALALTATSIPVQAKIINVPADSTTIQAAINGASNGDTVLVQPGTYVENINFNGKNIVVGSLFLTTGDTAYISQTVIDGNQSGSVVTFSNGEGNEAKLIGFSITNGSSNDGGGIFCNNFSSPTLSDLLVHSNSTTLDFRGYGGGGISCKNGSSPIITKSRIIKNSCTYGGGLLFDGSSGFINVTLSNVLIA